MREHALAGSALAAVSAHPVKIFANAATWQAHLSALGLDTRTRPARRLRQPLHPLDRLLARLHRRKDAVLRSLERPEIPPRAAL